MEKVKFDVIFEDDSKNISKLDKNEFKKIGKIAIIDQSKNKIAGYTSKEKLKICNEKRIIFGDHTRIIKYIDIPFVMGADGTKVLKIRDKMKYNYKYYYYYLLSSYIPNTGYNRHFKWLKELKFFVPSCKNQIEIVKELDKVQKIIDLNQKQIELLDEFIETQFVEMFGDPVLNEKEWEITLLENLGTLKNGMNYNRENKGYNIKFLGVGDFKNGNVINNIELLETINLDEKPSPDYMLKDEDIVFVRSNGSKELVGRSVLLDNIDRELTYSGFCIRFRKTTQKINAIFLINLLKNVNFFDYLKKDSRGANINNINQQILSKLRIILPPLELQNQFAEIVKKIDKQKSKVEDNLKKSQELMNTLMSKYFN